MKHLHKVGRLSPETGDCHEAGTLSPEARFACLAPAAQLTEVRFAEIIGHILISVTGAFCDWFVTLRTLQWFCLVGHACRVTAFAILAVLGLKCKYMLLWYIGIFN